MLSLVSSCVSLWFPGGSSAILVPLLDLHRHIYRCTLKFFDHTCDLLWRSTTFSQWFFPESIIYCSETTTWFSAAYLLTVTPFRDMTHRHLNPAWHLYSLPLVPVTIDATSCGFCSPPSWSIRWFAFSRLSSESAAVNRNKRLQGVRPYIKQKSVNSMHNTTLVETDLKTNILRNKTRQKLDYFAT